MADILYFLILKLAPDFAAIETGVGESLVVNAISKACGKNVKEIRALKKDEGDLGTVVQISKKTTGTLGGFFKKAKAVDDEKKYLKFNHVFSEFRRIATLSGQSSAAAKEAVVVKLLQAGTNDEAKFVVRFLLKTMKTGAAEKTVLMALSRAITYTPPNKPTVMNAKKEIGSAAFVERCQLVEHAIKQAVCECPDYALIVKRLLVVGDDHLALPKLCRMRVGVPVKPMLAKPTTGVHVVLERFKDIEFTCEYKYDGFRGQVHFQRDKKTDGCKIFSRNLEDMTVAYPDVQRIVEELVAADETVNDFIIDSELVAYDTVADKILPFQNLSQRSRKHVNEKDLKTRVAIQAFDLIYLNGRSLLRETFAERRKILRSTFKENRGSFMLAVGKDTSNFEDLEAFLDASIKDCCEGLMVKTLTVNSTYEPSKRSFNWLKLKKDYLDTGLGDTVDLCVVGADHGQGKRTGWYCSYLMAAWNEDLEQFQSVCKVGTGFSDEEFVKFKKQLDELVLTDDGPAESVRIKEKMPQVKCDVYFEPKVVWEIKAADLSLSPMHTACLSSVESDKGIALRFPRLVRERTDKTAEEATTTEQILDMFRSQAAVAPKTNFADDDDFDL